MNPNDTIKVGYLYKKGANRTNWKRRYFVLTGSELSYYPSENSIQSLGTIYLYKTTIKIDQSERKSGRSHCFSINPQHINERTYFLSCSSEEEKLDWIKAINFNSLIRPSVIVDFNTYPPLKQGYLIKEGHIRRNWKQRWFILKNNIMYYYKNRNDEKKNRALGVIPLFDSQMEIIKKGTNAFIWSIFHPTRKIFYLAAPDQNCMESWMFSINLAFLLH